MNDLELMYLLEECGYEPSIENVKILKEDEDAMAAFLYEAVKEEYSDYELYQILDECGYEPSVENLSVLKEGLNIGTYIIESNAESKKEGRVAAKILAQKIANGEITKVPSQKKEINNALRINPTSPRSIQDPEFLSHANKGRNAAIEDFKSKKESGEDISRESNPDTGSQVKRDIPTGEHKTVLNHYGRKKLVPVTTPKRFERTSTARDVADAHTDREGTVNFSAKTGEHRLSKSTSGISTISASNKVVNRLLRGPRS